MNQNRITKNLSVPKIWRKPPIVSREELIEKCIICNKLMPYTTWRHKTLGNKCFVCRYEKELAM